MQHESPRRAGARILVSASACLLAWAPALAAQTAVRAGQTVSGALTASSPRLDDNSHYQLYSYHGQAGEHVTVTLKSKAFDAYVAFGQMQNGTFKVLASDDDSGGGTDAQVEATVPATGDYLIRANTLAADETGDFTLTVTSGAAPASAQAASVGAVRGMVRVGQTVNGSLSASDPKADDDSYYQMWSFQGRAGQPLTIDLRSNNFDAYLAWGTLRDGRFSQIASDDDGGGNTDARLVVTPTADGVYAIRVNTLSAGETGAYTLTLTQGGTPTASTSSAPAGSGAASATAIVGSIQSGQTLSGALSSTDAKLSDDSYFRDYTFQGRAGERVTIVLRSTVFDTYLNFGRLDGGRFVSIDTDDDGAGGTDSKVEATLPADGTYVIRANALAPNTMGAFTLSVSSTR